VRALSRVVIRHPRLVVCIWMAVLAAAVGPAGTLSKKVSNGGYDAAGSQSSEVDRLVAERFTGGQREPLYVVLRGAGEPQRRLRARRVAVALRQAPAAHGIEVLGPRRGRGVTLVPFLASGAFAAVQERAAELNALVEAADPRARLLGEAPVWDHARSISREDLSRAESLALPLTLVVLLIAFLSVVAAGLPILLALASLLVAFAALSLLGNALELSVYVTNTVSVLVLGLAIDYSLFIVTRYRELRSHLGDSAAALEATLDTTGRAILFSGLTIALALSALAVVGLGAFTSMAIGASIAAMIAALGALTLTPAALRLLGARIDRLQLRPLGRAAQSARAWKALARTVLARPGLVLSGSVLLLAACALPLAGASLVYPSAYTLLPEGDELRSANAATERAFSPGALDSLEIVTDAAAPRALAAVRRAPGIAAAVVDGSSGRLTRISATPAMPAHTPAVDRLVRRLRAQLPSTLGAPVLVGGYAARGLDLVDRIESRLPWMIAVACALAFLLLLIAFRSLVLPAKAVLTNLLSVAATLGLVSLIFEVLGDSAGIAWFVPPFLFAIVFGLSMDYEIFLLSRFREEHLAGASNEQAITRALVRNARPITLAALVMAIVFLALGAGRLETFQQLGVGMAIAVFLDATVVRCALVPAALMLLGERNWWLPPPLGRILPAPHR
jgi:putative drug exporter of the RND superfamily